MPPIGDNRDAGGIAVSNNNSEYGNGNEMDNGSTANGNLTNKINEIKNLPENKITLNDLLMNLARSGNQKQEKLALDLLDLNMVESLTETETDTLEPDRFDKISVDRDQNKEETLGNNEESDMDWTTVRAKNKRNRSGSNDTEQINIAVNVSPNKKRKSDKKSNPQNGNKETGNGNKGQNQSKNVPEKAHKVVAIGVHQTISEDDIKTELANSNIKINKVQRLKFNGQPTKKVVIQFENEQDMKIALFSGIYFGRMRIRCESYRTTPSITQCYKCQGFNHVVVGAKMSSRGICLLKLIFLF